MLQCCPLPAAPPPCPAPPPLPAGALLVNFDTEVLQLMREARYLQRLGLPIPDSAQMVLLQVGGPGLGGWVRPHPGTPQRVWALGGARSFRGLSCAIHRPAYLALLPGRTTAAGGEVHALLQPAQPCPGGELPGAVGRLQERCGARQQPRHGQQGRRSAASMLPTATTCPPF